MVIKYTSRPEAKRLSANPKENAGIDLYPLLHTLYIFSNEGGDNKEERINRNARIEIRSDETVIYVFNPGTIVHVICPYRFAFPEGVFGIVYGRSGNFFKSGIEAFHGVIDSSYRGEIKVGLKFNTTGAFSFKNDIAIAQLVLFNAGDYVLEYVEQDVFLLEELNTSRNERGFGSSGRIEVR